MSYSCSRPKRVPTPTRSMPRTPHCRARTRKGPNSSSSSSSSSSRRRPQCPASTTSWGCRRNSLSSRKNTIKKHKVIMIFFFFFCLSLQVGIQQMSHISTASAFSANPQQQQMFGGGAFSQQVQNSIKFFLYYQFIQLKLFQDAFGARPFAATTMGAGMMHQQQQQQQQPMAMGIGGGSVPFPQQQQAAPAPAPAPTAGELLFAVGPAGSGTIQPTQVEAEQSSSGAGKKEEDVFATLDPLGTGVVNKTNNISIN